MTSSKQVLQTAQGTIKMDYWRGPRQVSIPSITLEEFDRLIKFDPYALDKMPFIVTSFVETQPASKLWLDFNYLKSRLGHLMVTAASPQFTTNKRANLNAIETTYSDYLAYIKDPDKAQSLFERGCVSGSYGKYKTSGIPLYCGSVRFVFNGREAMIGDLAPYAPKSIEIWNDYIPFYYQLKNHVWLYVSKKDSVTPLHQDNNGVISYLAQYKGIKRAVLFSPEDSPHYFNSDVGYLDLSKPNIKDFPTWQDATAWTGSLLEGQLLIWGKNWAHHVVTMDDSVTSSIDIVNLSNVAEYMSSMEWKRNLGRLVMGSEKARKFLQISNTKLDFTASEICLAEDLMRRRLEEAIKTCDAEEKLGRYNVMLDCLTQGRR